MDNVRLDNELIGRNIRAAREAAGLDLKDVAQKLRDTSRPLALNTLSKLETGRRKVAAEELIPLAVVLGVTPNVLLLGSGETTLGDDATENVDLGSVVLLESGVAAPLLEVWRWAQGEEPLRGELRSDSHIKLQDLRENREFRTRAKPHDPPAEVSFDDYRAIQEAGVLSGIDQAVQELRSRGLPLDIIRQHVDAIRTLEQVRKAVEDQAASGSS